MGSKRYTRRKRHQRGGVGGELTNGDVFSPQTKEQLAEALKKYGQSRSYGTRLYGSPETWDVGAIQDFSHLSNLANINMHNKNMPQGIEHWNMSNATDISYMFEGCTINEDLSNWNVSNVTNMEGLFKNCNLFDSPLNTWNVSNVTNMAEMFYGCKRFNQLLDQWNVSNVTDMHGMFNNCQNFNQPLDQWNVSNVTNMDRMFAYCFEFNQPLNAWNVSNVTNMSLMFFGASAFNQSLDHWNVSNVIDIDAMFSDASSFNQSLTTWQLNTQISEDMIEHMFEYCPISEENKPRLPEPFLEGAVHGHQGIAYQVHNAFHDVNVNNLMTILDELVPTAPNFATMNNPNFVNYIRTQLTDFIRRSFEPSQQQPLITAADLLYQNIGADDSSELLTAQSRPIFGKALFYMLQQPADLAKEYVKVYLEECSLAYGSNMDITNIDPNNLSCVKGRFERFVLSMKTVLLTQCIENPNAATCTADYKRILKDAFGVNMEQGAAIVLDKNELIQKWDAEHLDNDEYKTAHNVPAMSEAGRAAFFKADFIAFMRAAYQANNSLTPENEAMITNEANQLEGADVFRNMMFGGRRRRQSRRKYGFRRKRRVTKRQRRYRRINR